MRRVLTALMLTLFAAAIAFPQAKPGGIARQMSMGGAQVGSNIVVNPYLFTDPSWLLVNPAYQMEYANYAWLNAAGGRLVGNSNDINGNQFAGAHFGFGKEFSLGAILSYDPTATNTLWTSLTSYAGVALTRPPIENFEVLAATNMGGMSLGLGVRYGWNTGTTKNTPPAPASSSESEIAASSLGFRGGILFDLGGGSSVDGSVQLNLDKVGAKTTVSGTGAGTGTQEVKATATEIMVFVRAGLKVSKNFTFVPFGAFRTYSTEPSTESVFLGGTKPTNSLKDSFTGMAFGAGGEYHAKQFVFAGGVSFVSRENKRETNPGATPPAVPPPSSTSTSTLTGFPVFNMGAEYWVLDWMALRGGYYRAFGSQTSKNEPGGGTTTETTNSGGSSAIVFGDYGLDISNDNSLITVGLGLKFGAFALDAMVSENALRRGLGLVGSSDNINTFGYLNLSYAFE
jgi:hypothetical protein